MFYEEESLSDLLNCQQCNHRLDEPKVLPCEYFKSFNLYKEIVYLKLMKKVEPPFVCCVQIGLD